VALGESFDAVERIERRISVIVKRYFDEDAVDDRPTFETIGLLADFLHGARLEAVQLARSIESMEADLRRVINMREEVEAGERVRGGRDG
jgi:hypothetical protein